MLLTDKIALVTGASRGIGRAVAETFARQGASVVLVARSQSVNDVAHSLREQGATADVVQGDITDDTTVRACIKFCRDRHGRIDILVNNAGAMSQSVLGMVSIEDARGLLEVNLVTTINMSQYAIRLMKGSGTIINIASVAYRGLVGSSAYSAAKGGVVGFTLAAAKELAPRNIRVNAIAPGYIDTELTRNLSAENRSKALESIRMGRIGVAQDVANSVLFLASELSSYVTGQVLGVDGGMQV
jgi:3-oxoacyl-[acyl-carrier protein] reductase